MKVSATEREEENGIFFLILCFYRFHLDLHGFCCGFGDGEFYFCVNICEELISLSALYSALSGTVMPV